MKHELPMFTSPTRLGWLGAGKRSTVDSPADEFFAFFVDWVRAASKVSDFGGGSLGSSEAMEGV